MENHFIGIDENGKEYDVIKPQKNGDGTITALCKTDEWLGWLRCRFERVIGF